VGWRLASRERCQPPLSSFWRSCFFFGCVFFGNNPDVPGNGAFADYAAVPASLIFKIPDHLSFQQAATLGVGMATAGMVLFERLDLAMPSVEGQIQDKTAVKKKGSKLIIVLVYGGGTATGTIAIQLLRRSGFVCITTSSPRNFQRLKSLGAEEAFDYKSPTCGGDIREYTKDGLTLAMDCISNTGSMKICYEAISKKGGKYVALDPFPLHVHTRRSIVPDWIFLFTQFGKPVNWVRPYNFDARPKDKDFAERWYRVAEQLLAEGHITPHSFQEEQGGLGAVTDGLDAVRKGQVSGYKLVYTINA